MMIYLIFLILNQDLELDFGTRFYDGLKQEKLIVRAAYPNTTCSGHCLESVVFGKAVIEPTSLLLFPILH